MANPGNRLTTREQITLTVDKDVAEYLRGLNKQTGTPISRIIDNWAREKMQSERVYGEGN